MKIVFLDFAEEQNPVANSNAISVKRSGKFVQIRNNKTEYLVFSPKELSPYHADIVKSFCRKNGISGVYNNAQKHFEIYESEWVIIGGGKFELDKKAMSIRLYNDSMAYGKFESKGLKERMIKTKELSGYMVTVE